MLGSCLETAGRQAVGPARRASEASALTLERCTGQDTLSRWPEVGADWAVELATAADRDRGMRMGAGLLMRAPGPVLIALRYADMYSTLWRTKRAVGVGGAQGGGKSESPEVVNNKHAGRAGEGEGEWEEEGERGTGRRRAVSRSVLRRVGERQM
jgi:hypothetical protein